MMSTTITIPTELEKKIAERAATQGKNVEQFALEALERVAEVPSLRELFADVRDELGSSGVTDDELDLKLESAVKEVRKRRRA